MKRLVFFLIPISLLLVSCGDDSATNSSGGSHYVLQYPKESSTLALVESRAFRPPADLVQEIDRELAMIRDQWGDSIPEVLLEYNDPWEGWLGLTIRADTNMLNGTDTLARRSFDSVLAHFGAAERLVFDWMPDHRYIVPDSLWYPPAAVDSFAGLPGIRYICTNIPIATDGQYSTVRVPSDTGTYWYVGSDCQWSLRIHVFRVRGRRADLVDEFHYCFMNIDSAEAAWDAAGIPQDERWRIIGAYQDSALANMPEWYRSARHEIVGYVRCERCNSWTAGK